MREVWKNIVGYEGHYQVSSLGQIRALKRWVKSEYGGPHEILRPAMAMKLTLSAQGYLRVHVSKDAVPKAISVHRAVAEAFIPNPLNKPHVNHKDANKKNNSYKNLEWATPAENVAHAMANGLSPVGEQHHAAVLNEAKVRSIRKDKSRSSKELAEKYGVSKTQINLIKSRKAWAHVA